MLWDSIYIPSKFNHIRYINTQQAIFLCPYAETGASAINVGIFNEFNILLSEK
jgi:hypothetical protein